MTEVRINDQAIEDLLSSEVMEQELLKYANRIAGHVRTDLLSAPGVRVYVRSKRQSPTRTGAWAQVVMRDDEHVAGAMAIEFGTKGKGPRAPLRTALRREL